MTKEFCIAGPLDPARHYFIPHRLDWKELQRLIRSMSYFVLHAPRQSGKTTAVKEFIHYLNAEGNFHAIYINIESAQAAREHIEKGLLVILKVLLQAIKNQLPHESAIIEFLVKKTAVLDLIDLNTLNETFEYLAKKASKPVVLFIDEIDSLVGDTLLSVLRQIRAGFDNRPKLFPQALCLIGLRDVRDYRIWSHQNGQHISTSSPFNIKADSLELSNFSLEEIAALFQQHEQETGQQFTPDALDYVYHLSGGQPWLTNALAFQACYHVVANFHEAIHKESIDKAKEILIKKRATHLDSLLDKLREERVWPIIKAILIGETSTVLRSEDVQYVRDLGLIKQNSLEIANPIYQEVIPRELCVDFVETMTQTGAPFQKTDGTLNVAALMEAFTQFYRENFAIWHGHFDYKEAGPHLLMMAFLQRVINGGGTIQREYALGTGRVDILIRWRQQTFVIELKLFHGERTRLDGLQQTVAYMDVAQADEGHLVLFDLNKRKTWEEKVFHDLETLFGKTVHVWGM